MALPENPELTITSVMFGEGLITIEYHEDSDVAKTSMERHSITVPAEHFAEEAQEAWESLRDLWMAMKVAHRNPPDRLPG